MEATENRSGNAFKYRPLAAASLISAEIARKYPPVFQNENKRILYSIACPSPSDLRGIVEITRWPSLPAFPAWPGNASTLQIIVKEDIYTYEKLPTKQKAVEWHVNFADAHLFFGYGSALMAQDELQAAEMPVLCSIREFLLARQRAAASPSVDDLHKGTVMLRKVPTDSWRSYFACLTRQQLMVFKSEKSWLREGELSCLGSIVFENIRNIRYFSERENFIQIEYNTSAIVYLRAKTPYETERLHASLLAAFKAHQRKEAALMAEENLLPLTMQNGLPTPVLLRGVERRVALQVDVNELEGRPHGLYGRAFASSPPDAIRKAARILTPPQDVNLICMAAPKPASGTYTAEQLRLILLTALSAFTAAKVDSNTAFPGEDRITIIHTGHWGTGAYGGNKVVMALMQLIAAAAAGISTLVFHSVDQQGASSFQEAQCIFEQLKTTCTTLDECILNILALNYSWGVSNRT